MKTKGSKGGLAGATLVTALLLFAVLIAVPTPAAAASRAAGPTVDDGSHSIGYDVLNAGTGMLSGLRDNVISAQYEPDVPAPPGLPEILDCASGGEVRFTVNGTSPANSNKTVPLACEPGEEPPVLVYTGTINSDNLTKTPNGDIWFQIEIATGVMGDPFIDNNGGLFYKYNVDTSQARMTQRAPAPVIGSSLPDAVTSDTTPSVSFTVQDNTTGSAINQSRFQINLDNEDQTGVFTCTWDSLLYSVNCALNYNLLIEDFEFAQGTHTIVVEGADVTDNAFNETSMVHRFRVDTTDPVVSNVVATPNTFVAGGPGEKPTTGRGAAVTVRANVADANMNNNSQTDVVAYLQNTTRGLISPLPTGMKFNATTGVWEATNVQVPQNWPAEAFGVSAQVVARDQAGNDGAASSAGDQFQLDPSLPLVVEQAPQLFIKDTPTTITAKITDTGSGLNPDKITIRFSNVTGKFKAAPSGVTKINNNTFEGRMARVGSTDNFTFTIPAAEGGTLITYTISAQDRAGGVTTTAQRSMIVDLTGPNVAEVSPRAFRGIPPIPFRFTAIDSGIGVDNVTGKIFYSTGGSFQTADLVHNAQTNEYTVSISPTATDGQTLRYYVEIKDKLGNTGRLGSSSAPATSIMDLVAPTVNSVTSPATATTSTFAVQWSGTDARSGIDTYTVQARVNDGSPTDWITIALNTKDTTMEFCGEGGHKYEFRVVATDKAGNTGPFPSSPQSSTQLSGAGCQEQILASVIAPGAGTTINARATPNYIVKWSASSTRTFTPSADLRIEIRFSPDGGRFYETLATNQVNDGEHSIAVKDLPVCASCRISVIASTLTGVTATGTSESFRIVEGSLTADLDGNGLPDSWEVKYGGAVGETDPEEDTDGDGLDNLEESRLGTDPRNKDTDGDGASDRTESRVGTNPLNAQSVPSSADSRSEQFDDVAYWWISAPAIFLVCAILFFVGLARRW